MLSGCYPALQILSLRTEPDPAGDVVALLSFVDLHKMNTWTRDIRAQPIQQYFLALVVNPSEAPGKHA